MQITIGILSLITALYATQSVPNLATPTTLAQSEELQMSEIVEAFPTFAPLDQPWTGKISITGSDTMATALSALADSFMSIYPKCTVVVRGGGSEDGIASFIAGECDFASVSRALSTEEKNAIESATKKKIIQITIAADAVCVFVNKDNPLKGMTSTQLNGAFSITHLKTKAPIFRWNEIDPTSPLGDEWIRLHTGDRGSGTVKDFVGFAMPGERFTTSLCFIEPTPSAVINACCAYKNALGIASFALRQPRARALAISAKDDGPFVEPSFKSIYDGSYPLSRPLTLVTFLDSTGKLSPMMTDFLRYVFSETGEDLLSDLYLVTLHPDQIPTFIQAPATAAPATSAPATAAPIK